LSSPSSSPSVEAEQEIVRVQPDDLHELRIESLTQIGELISRYEAVDAPKEDPMIFLQHLTARRDAWFVEVADVGLIYLTNIILDRDADFNFIFWDGHLTLDRVAAIKSVITTAFERFGLPRLSAAVPYTNPPSRRVLTDVGFVLEGTIRRGWTVTPPVDAIIYGMLLEESPGLALPMPLE